MSSHEWFELNDIVNKAAKALRDNEQLPLEVLAVKARKLAEAYPADQTSVSIYNFLNKRASSGQLFMRRSELREVYGKLATSNNKFSEHFAEEFGLEKQAARNVMVRDPKEGQDLVQGAYDSQANPILSNQLKAAFDKDVPYMPYSEKVAKDAKRTCAHELNCCGALPKKTSVVAGKEDVLICKATYDTPAGEAHVLIPVEISGDKTLMPSMFLSQDGFVEITAKALEDHIKKTAGKSFRVDVQMLLNDITEAKRGPQKEMTELERIVMAASADAETPNTHTVNAVLYQEVDPAAPNVETPEFEQSDEVQEFAKALTSAAGVAEFVFGREAVERGRSSVKLAMASAGYKNTQIGISDTDDNTIFYAVSTDGANGFTVPVKVANKVPQVPGVAVSSAGVFDLSSDGVGELLSQGADSSTAAKASSLYYMKPAQLIEQIRQSLSEGNYKTAEEALNVLKSTGDDTAYRTGYAAYVAGLKGDLKKEAAVQCKCAATVKSPNSKYLICSHTGLPVHQVYQDENGDCKPMYRKSMSETSDGGEDVTFLHSKVFLD